MNKLQELKATRQVAQEALQVLLAKKDEDLSETEVGQITAKANEIEALNKKIEEQEKIEEIARKNAEEIEKAKQVDPSHRPSMHAGTNPAGDGAGDTIATLNFDVPAVCKGRTPQHLMRACGNKREEAQKIAYALGAFTVAAFGREPNLAAKMRKWCEGQGFMLRAAQAENVNTLGGVLVPVELANYVIQLMEEFGVARRLMRNEKMTGDTKNVPRRNGTVSAYWLVDNQAISASAKTWDMIELVAKKLGMFTYYSNEIAEDSMIDIGDDLAGEFAWMGSFMEDNAAFNGDGTSTYGNILGLGPAFLAAFPPGGPGIVVGTAGSGAAFSGYTLGNFTAVQGNLPQYAWKRGVPTWYCSQQFYYGAMVPIAAAAGGNRIDTILEGAPGVNGKRQPIFLGCPVEFVQALPSVASVSTIDCYFGALNLAATFGDRRQLAIAMSDQIGFSADQLAIRGISRQDINVHDVGGNGANTLAQNPKYDQTGNTYYAGPLVALESASS